MRIHITICASTLVAILTVLLACEIPSTTPWRSQLYPEDWTPGFADEEGRFLHDFSYAGYKNGEQPLPESEGAATFDVITFGADPSGASDSTLAIQSAIDAAQAASGGIVFFPEGLYRCDDRLFITASNIILRGEGPELSRLYFTAHENMSDKQHIEFNGSVTREPDIALAFDGQNQSFSVQVIGGGDLLPGDEVSLGWVITDEFVEEHAMTGTWQAFNGQWKPFFRREILQVQETYPLTIVLDVPLRYPAKLRDAASLRRETGYIEKCGIESLGVANAVSWQHAWANDRNHLIRFRDAKDCWIRDVASFASPLAQADGFHLQSGGIKVLSSKRITIADCQLSDAQNRGGGGNGYLFEVSTSSEILFRDCVALNGRHNFIQNWDFGTSGCVFLRCFSDGSKNVLDVNFPLALPAYSEYHHSLAMACLVDSTVLDDGWSGGNRNDFSSGAGHTVTQSVYWNTTGTGRLRSWQFGLGYIIGTARIAVDRKLIGAGASGTAPKDYLEGKGDAAALLPVSLYEDQLARRLAL